MDEFIDAVIGAVDVFKGLAGAEPNRLILNSEEVEPVLDGLSLRGMYVPGRLEGAPCLLGLDMIGADFVPVGQFRLELGPTTEQLENLINS